jgi:hypothetical protein
MFLKFCSLTHTIIHSISQQAFSSYFYKFNNKKLVASNKRCKVKKKKYKNPKIFYVIQHTFKAHYFLA